MSRPISLQSRTTRRPPNISLVLSNGRPNDNADDDDDDDDDDDGDDDDGDGDAPPSSPIAIDRSTSVQWIDSGFHHTPGFEYPDVEDVQKVCGDGWVLSVLGKGDYNKCYRVEKIGKENGDGLESGNGDGSCHSILRLTSPINGYWKTESEVATMFYIQRCTVSLSSPQRPPFIPCTPSLTSVPPDHPYPSYPPLQFYNPQRLLFPLHHDGLPTRARSRRGLEGTDDADQGRARTTTCGLSSRDV